MIDPQIKMKQGMKYFWTMDGPGSLAYIWPPNVNDLSEKEMAERTLIRPADDDKASWELFLPDAPLADTGPKVFKVGQVWASRTNRMNEPFVWAISDGCAQLLAGKPCFDSRIPDINSIVATHSVLLFDAPESNQPAIPESSPVTTNDVYAAVKAAWNKLIPELRNAVVAPPSAVRPCMTCTAPIDYARLGPYQPRWGICEECIAYNMTGISGTDVQRESNDRLATWAAGISRQMAVPAPGRTLIVGGIVSPLRTDDGWRRR